MRLRNGTVATVLAFITSFLTLSWYTTWQNGKEKLIAYQREFLALKERLRIAEHRISQRSSELNAIVQQFKRVGAETNGSKDALNKFSDNTLKLLKELTSKKSLQVPSIYYHLPHLLQNERSLQPALQIGNGRTGVSIVMGIPTVKREVKSYLIETLHSLIDNLYPEEKLDCVIVVFIGETDSDYVHSVVANLEKEFSKEISSGLVEIISPPESYYPDLTNLKETFGDSKERVRWRTKQNLDYCFLMMYAQEKGIYYIQKHCDRQKANLRIRFRPSLFQHVGLHSSLSGKIQKLTDKDYMKPLLLKIHVNPPAEISTSLKVYQGHTLEKTYMGEDFFWAITPIAGDYILFKFDKPVNVESYLFHSGNQEHPGDILLNTTVEVLPLKSEGLEISKETKDKRLEDGYFRIGKFENGVAEGMVDPSLNPISAFRLSVIQNSAVWAILNEIHIKKVTN
ncbi:alpha-1,3-mannosyl-glycoprotein 4-beta-N-acetylglucosaminyltransferase A isoform X3 [Acinonyx jubatus]|uniref:Alpha-1,3-mannosyl-glycoprotein 4-beta-N-acetylglucosaminyltransferase A n=1 Tax=Acinonyx jubatus TaxID=32536 RepID=A0ABM3NAK6_ACIJB|nr:alpha-1,3-mannosyl-glycoprotein 4-beta-N-acetylglucosaminyltransferase A isoform X3 [Felis catus]XP_053056459.1 alpha-1,3-mannosyl-glycoprotein 4-beta-N-acetylglucosaminyltransferase A isoform X3 [Acinonyx jubatus]